MLKSMLHGIEAGFRFFTGTRLSTLFGLSLRDPSRVRGVRTLAGASWENGLPLELEIVELSDGISRLKGPDESFLLGFVASKILL